MSAPATIVTTHIACSGLIFFVTYVTKTPAAIRLTTFVVTQATIIRTSAIQPSPRQLTSELRYELYRLYIPVDKAVPIVEMMQTKANQSKATQAPIIGAIVAVFTVGVYLVNSATPSTQAKLKAAIISIAFPVGSMAFSGGRQL